MSLDAKPYSRGAEISHKTATRIPAEAKLRPLKDWLIVAPHDRTISAIIEVVSEEKPIRGTVLATGPGRYPIRYNHPEKNKRTKMWDSKAFRPCDVQVGDTVGFEPRAFQSLYWGDQFCLMIREEDVTGIHERAHAAA